MNRHYVNFRIPAIGEPLTKLESCPLTHKLDYTVNAKIKAPIDLGLIAILSAYSTLIQSIINVERPEAGIGPVSLYTIGIAPSGERKTSITNYLLKSIIKYQEEEMERYRVNLKMFEFELTGYELEVKNLKALIFKMQLDGEPFEELKKQLMSLIEAEPKPLKIPQFIIEDTSPEAFSSHLHEGLGHVALISSEGSTILNGRTMQNIPMYNKSWGGETFTVNRKKAKSYVLTDTRVGIFLLVQLKGVEKFMDKKGDESKGIGLLARFIICDPPSTQGSRFIVKNSQIDETGYQEYLQRVDEVLLILKERTDNQTKERKVVKFDDEAADFWIWVFNYIEEQLQPGGRFQYAKDHGSKLAENIARIAALLTYIELGEDQQITAGILRDAVRIGFYFSDSFLRIFNFLPDEQLAYNALNEWFNVASEDGLRYIRKNRIRQSGPVLLRKTILLDFALNQMLNEGLVNVLISGKGMHIIDLNPQLPLEQERLDKEIMTK
mgnify:CR=1 FL=1